VNKAWPNKWTPEKLPQFVTRLTTVWRFFLGAYGTRPPDFARIGIDANSSATAGKNPQEKNWPWVYLNTGRRKRRGRNSHSPNSSILPELSRNWTWMETRGAKSIFFLLFFCFYEKIGSNFAAPARDGGVRSLRFGVYNNIKAA